MSEVIFSSEFSYQKMPPSIKERDPEWLASLRGDSPLLELPELDSIAELRHCILQEARCRPSIPCDQHLKHNLSIMKDNFQKVVEYLKGNSRSKEHFLRTYPTWRIARSHTVVQLMKIAESVNADSQNCSVSRGVGSTASLIGGLMCLAAGNGALRVAGGVLMGLGSITSAGASSAELGLLRKKVKEAEKIILEDREYTEKLWNWISDLSNIQKALSIIRDINVDLNLKKVANVFHGYCKMKSRKCEITKNIRQVVKYLEVSPQIANEIFDVVGILTATSMLYDRYRPFFNQVFQAYKCNKMLSTAFDVVSATFRVTSAVNASKSSELTTIQKSKILSGMALDAISIVLATEGANATSKEAKEITKAAENLKEEAEIIKKLHSLFLKQ